MLGHSNRGDAAIALLLATIAFSSVSLLVISRLTLFHNQFYEQLLESSRRFNHEPGFFMMGKLQFEMIPPRADYGAYHYQQDSLAVCQIGRELDLRDILQCDYDF